LGNPATTVKLAAKQRSSMSLALDADGAGTAQLDVDIRGPEGLTLARHYALDVKAATQILARRTIRTLAKGESLTLTSDMFSDLVPGTGSVSLSAGLSTALDAATILKALDRYPHGCSEQITSRAMPLLYVNELAAGAHLAIDTEVDQRIKDAIDRLLARQGSNGSFGLWSAGGDDAWLDAYVTDFLTRAREKGFAVPDILFKSALDRIRNSVVNANEPEKDGGRHLAYGLYVLARMVPRQSVTCAISPIPSSTIWRRQSPNRNWRQRWRWSAIATGQSGSMPQPSTVSRRNPHWSSAGSITARRCATPRL